MAGSTINIAEFRCRAMQGRTSHSASHRTSLPFGLTAVESEPPAAQAPDIHEEALISENPAVFDIGIARRAQQHMRSRVVFRPVSIQRPQATVIRFGERGAAVMRSRNSERQRRFAAASHDPDLPPAA